MIESRTFPEDSFTYEEKMGLVTDLVDHDSIHPLVSRQSFGRNNSALSLDVYVSEDGLRLEAQADGDPIIFELTDSEIVDLYLNMQRVMVEKMKRSPAFKDFYLKSIGL